MKTTVLLVALLTAGGLTWVGCGQKETPQDAADAPLTSTAAVASPTTPIELKLKWPVGARYVQRMDLVQQMETTMTGLARTNQQEVETSQDFGLTVLAERPEGGREIEMDFLGMQMMVSEGDRTVLSFDSHGESVNAAANPMAGLLRQMVGARIKFILDASNQVVRLEGLQDFRNRVMSNAPPALRGSLGPMLSEDTFKQMINFGQGLPGKPVRPGDSWPEQTDLVMGPMGVLQLDLQHVFKDYDQRDGRTCARIEFAGLMKSKVTETPPEGSLASKMQMNIEDGTTSGQRWFDPDLGMLVGTEAIQDLVMKMEVPAQTGAPGGNAPPIQGFSMRIKQKLTITITPDK